MRSEVNANTPYSPNLLRTRLPGSVPMGEGKVVVDITCIFSLTAILHVLQHIPPMDGDQGGMGMEMLGLVDAVPMNKSFF